MNDSDKIDKLYQDMYVGDGSQNPSITTRLSVAEERVDKLESLVNKAMWSVIGAAIIAAFTFAGDIILRIMK